MYNSRNFRNNQFYPRSGKILKFTKISCKFFDNISNDSITALLKRGNGFSV